MPQGQAITYEQAKALAALRRNRHSYRAMAEFTGFSTYTCQKYTKDVVFLDRAICKPLEQLGISQDLFVAPDFNKVTTQKPLKEAFTPRELSDHEYFLQEHVEGKRFEGDLNRVSMSDLREMMAIPTEYSSPLSIQNWCIKYLAGKGDGRILQHPPYQWSKSQFDMMQFWRDNQRSMFETFRDAGKTMTGTGIITHEMAENRDNNYFIMSETDMKAARRIRQIGNIFLMNKAICADYGFLPHIDVSRKGKRESWSSKEITLQRTFSQTDPSLMSFSTQSAGATGAHFAGGVFDDVWSFKLEQKSLENKEKWMGWFTGELEGCLEDAWELFLLTRKGPTDLYQDLEDSGLYAVFKRPAILNYPSDWKVIYRKVGGADILDHVEVYSNDGRISDDGNGRFSMEYFLFKRQNMIMKKKGHMFESEYQLNPLAFVGKYFKTDMIRSIYGVNAFFEMVGTAEIQLLGCMDLAFSNEPTADYNALVIVAQYRGQFYFLQTYLKRTAFDEDRVAMLRQAKLDFPTLTTVYIEADLQQSAKVQELQRKVPFLTIRPVHSREQQRMLEKSDDVRKTQLTGKALRIHSQLEDCISSGILHANVHMRHYAEFITELKHFPKCEHFDVIDALGNCIALLKGKSALWFALSGGEPLKIPDGKPLFFVRGG